MKENIKQLIQSSEKVVGMKQVLRGIIEGDIIRCVIIAQNVGSNIKDILLSTAKEHNVKVEFTEDMEELGSVVGIDVKASVVGILK